MGHSSKIVAVVAPLSWILSCTLVAASPMDNAGRLAPSTIGTTDMGTVSRGLGKREDEDDDEADIFADGTGPVRDGMIISKVI